MKNDAGVSVDILYALNEYSLKRRININKVYRDAGFDFQHIIKNNLRVPVKQFYTLWEAVLKESADLNFGLHVALGSINYQKKNDILFSILSNSSGIEQALKNLIRYHDITSNLIRIRLDLKNNTAVLSWNSFAFIEQDRHYSESIMAILAFLLSTLSDNKLRINEIRFIHNKPANIEEQIQLFKCRLYY